MTPLRVVGLLRSVAARNESTGRVASRVALAAVLVGSGLLHVLWPRAYDRMVPEWALIGPIDRSRVWTLASAVAEIVSGVLLAVPATRRAGAWAAAATLVGVFPANVEAARRGGMPAGGWFGTPVAAWLRLPLQIPLVGWALAHRNRLPR